ncbi:MAG: hypothetical protein HC854_16735 [Flavobacterium sp.]|nr:hypothetical protein [Flavobacterium sp.]
MKKSILNVAGAQELSKVEQKEIKGGFGYAAELCAEDGQNGDVVVCYPPTVCAFNGSYAYCKLPR